MLCVKSLVEVKVFYFYFKSLIGIEWLWLIVIGSMVCNIWIVDFNGFVVLIFIDYICVIVVDLLKVINEKIVEI